MAGGAAISFVRILLRAVAGGRHSGLVDGADPQKSRWRRRINRQTGLPLQEIESHQRTDEQLQSPPGRRAGQPAKAAISRPSATSSTPLNSILGYAQILVRRKTLPTARRCR